MQFRISWTNEVNQQESLSFCDQIPAFAAPAATIYGRRFYLHAAECQDVAIFNKVCELQSALFANIEQFAEGLQLTVLKNRKVELQKEVGGRRFLEKTIPSIEMARIGNCNAQQMNPYFQANSIYDGQLPPLLIALNSKNLEMLKQLVSNPYLLLINEKFLFVCPDGVQRSVTPLEYAIIQNDLEMANILMESPAFNKETALPLEALKILGPDKATPFIGAYIRRKPNLIDTTYFTKGFAEMKEAGFSDEAITLVRNYYEANASWRSRDDAVFSSISIRMDFMLQEPLNSEGFKNKWGEVLDLFRSPETNLDALIDNVLPVIAHVCDTFCRIDSVEGIKNYSNFDEKKPFLYALISEILKSGNYTVNGSVYRYLRDLPPSAYETIPKETLEAYQNSLLTRYPGINMPTEFHCLRAIAARRNLVTLLGKPKHVSQQLFSPQQERQWNKQLKLSGGNDRKGFGHFVKHLWVRDKPFSKAVDHVLLQYYKQEDLEKQWTYDEGVDVVGIVDNKKNRLIAYDLLDKINNSTDITYVKLEPMNHTYALLFYKGFYMVCDRRAIVDEEGKRVRGADIKVYSYKKKMEFGVLWVLLDGKYDAITIDFLKANLDSTLLHEISLKRQKYPNCSWSSDLAPALLVATQLEKNPDTLLKEGKFDSDVTAEMHSLTHYAKYVAIQNYVTTHRLALTESVGYPDAVLTGKALLYTLSKCALKGPSPDPHYLQGLDELVYSGLAIAADSASWMEYSPEEQEKMQAFLEERYALQGIKEYLGEWGYPITEGISDAEMFLRYLTNPRPSNGFWPRSLVS